jgi:MerR family copper efflux transcriptional regulator
VASFSFEMISSSSRCTSVNSRWRIEGIVSRPQPQIHLRLGCAMVAIRPISLDSGLRSRLYDFVMATNHETETTAMQIGEVAKRTSLTVDAIRFYEKRKLLPKAVRSAGRFRLYGEGTIERLHFIQQLQGLGFSLREVGELIQLRERKVDACESVRELVKAKLTDVRAKLQELRHLESELEMDLRKCNRELNHRRQHASCACPVLEDAAGVSQ